MSIDEGAILLPIARSAIAKELGISFFALETGTWLEKPGACFVTLTQDGRLRGCIGSLQPHQTLLSDLKKNAVSAAFHDPRFDPLTKPELPQTTIEISLLDDAKAIEFRNEADAISRLRPGQDGVIFEFSRHRSTFLPQVWEQLPEPDQFMAHLKRKAGLPKDFWHPEIRLARYSVRKYSETEYA